MVLLYRLQQNISVGLPISYLLNQFSLQLGETGSFNVLILGIADGALLL